MLKMVSPKRLMWSRGLVETNDRVIDSYSLKLPTRKKKKKKKTATGRPIRLHMKNGHNVVLGGSHYDEYIVEYVDVSASTYQDPALFLPPSTMECIDFGQSK